MELTVNGAGRSVPDGTSVADLVRDIVPEQRGVAVAVNGEVVPRAGWPATALRDGDRVEVLTAAQGG
ncbi:sulfur carrier protein ThiS [Micromonospora sp. WMMD1155]|uniref:sulfur carrier protein ThiS n=1 Tax=Micromonospora sp. WMMD1155 TaxID=3016094 RepID=UPI00249BF2B1|nr:sulfur carrier protein ThiS [Micromonospora sp. WMMD1155]WFE51769.1 sulfur carrier protein ThiS [Micromonospora sp. WMMD1155]